MTADIRIATVADLPALAEMRRTFTFEDPEHEVELLVVWPSEESLGFYERAGFASGRDPLVWMRE